MAITVEMMEAAARSGLSVVCSSCEKYWEARGKGILGDACLAIGRCGSPLIGDDFSEYRGIMTESAFGQFCFVCGKASVTRLRKHGHLREIGICAEHFSWMKDYAMRNPLLLRLGEKPEKKPLARKGSLLAEILKTEEDWANQEGREFDPQEVISELRAVGGHHGGSGQVGG